MRLNHMNRKLFLCFALVVSVVCAAQYSGCGSSSTTVNPQAEKFTKFVDAYFNGEFDVSRPTPVSFAWLRSDQDSFDAAGAQRALTALHAIDTLPLSIDDRIDWLEFEAQIKRQILDTTLHDDRKDPAHYLAFGDMTWSVQRDLSVKEWRDLLGTLRNAPEAMRIGRAQLQSPPPLWLNLAVRTATRYEAFLPDKLAPKIDSAAPPAMRDSLTDAVASALRSLSAYRKFLQDTIKTGPEQSWAVGPAYYDELLKDFHFLPYTSETMIEAGRKKHAETKAELAALCKRIDPTKTVAELITALKSRHPEPYQITDAYHRESDRVKRLLIEKNLVDIPQPETLLFVPTPPALRETYAWGGFGGIEERNGVAEGHFFVTDIVPEMTPPQVQEKLRIQNNGWITVIALHEGYAGHHLQELYAMKSPRKVRQRFSNTYYEEGWALYAESWMGREGFYQNADDSLAWLQMRLWRTARVIVDPSIHTGKMTYDDAVNFMVNEVGLERSAAEAEVNRYTTWPTQAPSYIIGWLEIEKLKQEMQKVLGDKYDDKVFVENVLKAGGLPLELMRRAVLNEYGM
jgi:uncharacterized protein (DUF885 family)